MNDIHPLKPPAAIDWLSIISPETIVVTLGLIVLLFALWFLLQNKKPTPQPKAKEQPKPQFDAKTRARTRLEKLQAEQSQHKATEVYVHINEIMREYLGARFGVAALRQTRRELLVRIKPLMPKAEYEIATKLLAHVEEGEFAGSNHTEKYLENTFTLAFDLLDQ
jgi:hypothetical protein